MRKRGITFLLAIIVSTLALSLGLGIASVLLDEFKLSNINKDSFTAFFAADSGGDCALYWDLKKQSVVPNANARFFMWPSQGVLQCNGQIPVLSITIVPRVSTTTVFNFDLNNKCASVTVNKTGANGFTIITSLGKNISCGAASTPRTVQRGIEVRY